ncbi:hypothetical protein SUDANB178_00397 [Streptomyces sp. enrichment culture]
MSTPGRLRVYAVCVAVPAATATTTTSATATTTGSDPLARFHRQHVTWHGCALGPDDDSGRELDAAGADCADITVPLDYSAPGGRTISVALSRLKATDTAHRVGLLLLNDGGPAGPGLHMPPTISRVMGEVAGRYDLIGMDPRFVGRSTPLDCGWNLCSAPLRSAGSDSAAYREEVAVAREPARRCERTHGDVLPYVTTRNTARGMDGIRAALCADTVSYLGYSYGSYLGEVYTQLFPGRTDRMVLDGVMSPERYSFALLRGAEAANEAALRAWASWAVARHHTYRLGATRGQVLATVRRVLDAVAQAPLRIGKDYLPDEHVLPALIIGGLGSDLDHRRAALADTVRLLARAADRKPVEPSEALAGQLEFLLAGAGSAAAGQMTSIICGDVAERRGTGGYRRAIEASRERYPLAGPVAGNITPCEFRQRPAEAPTVLHNDVPVLLVAATGDPRTPYPGAETVRERWPSSRLLTVAGARQHGLYGEYGNACVDEHVNAYLRTGRLPAHDPACSSSLPRASASTAVTTTAAVASAAHSGVPARTPVRERAVPGGGAVAEGRVAGPPGLGRDQLPEFRLLRGGQSAEGHRADRGDGEGGQGACPAPRGGTLAFAAQDAERRPDAVRHPGRGRLDEQGREGRAGRQDHTGPPTVGGPGGDFPHGRHGREGRGPPQQAPGAILRAPQGGPDQQALRPQAVADGPHRAARGGPGDQLAHPFGAGDARRLDERLLGTGRRAGRVHPVRDGDRAVLRQDQTALPHHPEQHRRRRPARPAREVGQLLHGQILADRRFCPQRHHDPHGDDEPVPDRARRQDQCRQM